jgi:hypothetical protein
MFTIGNWGRGLAIAVVGIAVAGASGRAVADESQWQRNHPRRAEVNHRLLNQNRRIHQEVKEGELTHQQAAKLHQDDHQIRQEERGMASQNGGHITAGEQRVLNHQENAVSQQIGR